MLGLYLIIGHKSCNMLGLLNKLTLQKKSQNVWTNYVFLNKKVKAQQQNKKIKHKNPCRSRELNPEPLTPKADALRPAPPSQLGVTIVVQLFNCFNAMGQNVSNQSRICRPHIFNEFIFS